VRSTSGNQTRGQGCLISRRVHIATAAGVGENSCYIKGTGSESSSICNQTLENNTGQETAATVRKSTGQRSTSLDVAPLDVVKLSSSIDEKTNNPSPRLPQEAGILRDESRQPACPPSQAPSPIYLHRDFPPTQAPSLTTTKQKVD
jgi:hypothetical protein